MKDDKAARELIKGSKWNLLGNWVNLPDRKTKIQLNELLESNQALLGGGRLLGAPASDYIPGSSALGPYMAGTGTSNRRK